MALNSSVGLAGAAGFDFLTFWVEDGYGVGSGCGDADADADDGGGDEVDVDAGASGMEVSLSWSIAGGVDLELLVFLVFFAAAASLFSSFLFTTSIFFGATSLSLSPSLDEETVAVLAAR